MARKHRNSTKFSIEDAFEEDLDDTIRIYGATNERSPLKLDADTIKKDPSIEVKVETPGQFKERPDLHTFGFLKNHNNHGFLLLPTESDNISRDSDSLIHQDYNNEDIERSSWWCQHPKVKENWRIILGAFLLFILGISLLLVGIFIEIVPIDSLSGSVFLIAGLICFIPGVYHVVFIVLAVYGKAGYDLYSLPLFS